MNPCNRRYKLQIIVAHSLAHERPVEPLRVQLVNMILLVLFTTPATIRKYVFPLPPNKQYVVLVIVTPTLDFRLRIALAKFWRVKNMPKIIHLISPNFSDIFTPNIEIGQFPDGDSHVKINPIAECKGAEVTVFHRLYPKQNTALVGLLLILDSLKEAGAKRVSVVAPYLPYSRQDKKKLNGEVASAFVVCNLLARAGCDKLVTFDCHFLNKEGAAEFGELKIENISMGKALVEYAKARRRFVGEACEVISPDMGANYLVKEHGGKSFKKVAQGI